MDKHDHLGPWWGIGIALIAMLVVGYILFLTVQHQFEVIYDRVGEMQRQLECPPGELLVTDQDGVEYCIVEEVEG